MQTGRAIGAALAVATIVVDAAGYDHIAVLERGSLAIERFAVPANAAIGPRDATAPHSDKGVRPRLSGEQVARISGAFAEIAPHLHCLALEGIALAEKLRERERLLGGAASSDPDPGQGDRQPHSFET